MTPFDGTGAPKLRLTLALQPLCRGYGHDAAATRRLKNVLSSAGGGPAALHWRASSDDFEAAVRFRVIILVECAGLRRAPVAAVRRLMAGVELGQEHVREASTG